MTLADEFFEARYRVSALEDELGNALLRACGVRPETPNAWPLGDITFDEYDSSFEFKAVTPGWVPTVEQLAACFALGFSRCWINYTDDAERYFYLKDGAVTGGTPQEHGTHFGYNGDKKRKRLQRALAWLQMLEQEFAEREHRDITMALERQREAIRDQ